MSRGRKDNRKRKPANTGNPVSSAGKKNAVRTGAADLPAFVPGFMMCALTGIVLILDILLPSMYDGQYEVYPLLFRVMDYALIACGLVYIGMAARSKELRFRKTDALFAAFAALILLSTFVNGFTREALNGIPYRNIGIFNMLAFMLIYMGVSRRLSSESLKERVLIIYLAVADAVGVSVLADLYITAIPAYREKKELSAIFFNGNHYGYFLLMAIVIGIGWYMYGDRKEAAFGAASAALNMLILVFNHSMGCILAVAGVTAGMAICVLIRDRDKAKRLAALAGVLAACFIAAVAFSSGIRSELVSLGEDLSALMSGNADSSLGHNRFLLWDLTLGYIKEKPFLGSGCEGIAFRLYEATGRSNPHSELLTYAAYYGIPAAVCYAAGVISIFIRYFRERKSAPASVRIACMAAAGYFISSFFGVAMFYTAPFFFIFLGLTDTEKDR